jgi:hypothetical protein
LTQGLSKIRKRLRGTIVAPSELTPVTQILKIRGCASYFSFSIENSFAAMQVQTRLTPIPEQTKQDLKKSWEKYQV